MTETKPLWLEVGAEVLLYNDAGPGRPRHLKRCTVARVATKSFTVNDPGEPRFPIDRLKVWQGGSWGWTRHVTPVDSETARELLEQDRRDRLVQQARVKTEDWLKHRTQDNRLAAIAALQSVED